MKRGYWLAVALMLLMPYCAAAQAAGPVNPTTIEVTLPQTNADGSNLVDLKDARFCVGLAGAPTLTNCVTVPVATLDPPAGAKATTPIAPFNITADGQYEVDADAGDTAGNRGAKHVRVPFEWNRQAPAAPSGLRLVP